MIDTVRADERKAIRHFCECADRAPFSVVDFVPIDGPSLYAVFHTGNGYLYTCPSENIQSVRSRTVGERLFDLSFEEKEEIEKYATATIEQDFDDGIWEYPLENGERI